MMSGFFHNPMTLNSLSDFVEYKISNLIIGIQRNRNIWLIKYILYDNNNDGYFSFKFYQETSKYVDDSGVFLFLYKFYYFKRSQKILKPIFKKNKNKCM